MVKIIGRFYFKMTKNGNLIGEYSNSGMSTIDSESANAKTNQHGFIGKYESVWSEDDKSFLTLIEIEHRDETNQKLYSLKWKKNKKTIFWGEGMIVDDMLIGDYRNFSSII